MESILDLSHYVTSLSHTGAAIEWGTSKYLLLKLIIKLKEILYEKTVHCLIFLFLKLVDISHEQLITLLWCIVASISKK